MLLVEPLELLDVERRGGLVDVPDVERADHLLASKHFLVTMRPAEAHQVVQQRIRQVTLLLVLQHADCAMALGKLGSVSSEDHRHMRVHR